MTLLRRTLYGRGISTFERGREWGRPRLTRGCLHFCETISAGNREMTRCGARFLGRTPQSVQSFAAPAKSTWRQAAGKHLRVLMILRMRVWMRSIALVAQITRRTSDRNAKKQMARHQPAATTGSPAAPSLRSRSERMEICCSASDPVLAFCFPLFGGGKLIFWPNSEVANSLYTSLTPYVA